MHSYRWKGIDQHGTKKRGITYASSPQELEQHLLTQRIALLEYKQPSPLFSYFTIHKNIPPQLLITFFEHLTSLTQSGIDLPTALNLFVQQTSHKPFNNVISKLSHTLQHGQSFSYACGYFPDIFPLPIRNFLQSGEKTGAIDNALAKITQHLKDAHALKKEVSRAMTLPSITLTFSSLIIVGIFIFIIPQFAELFTSMEKPLPPLTQTVFSISTFLRQQNGLFFIVSLFCIPLVLKRSRKLSLFKKFTDIVELHTPWVSSWHLQKTRISILQTIALLLHAGIPLKHTLEQTLESIENKSLKKKNTVLLDAVVHGESLEQGMQQVGKKYYPEHIVSLVATGEHTGNLPDMLDKAVHLETKKLQNQLKLFTSILQPMLLIIVGFFIAGLMLIIYLPIFSMASLF